MGVYIVQSGPNGPIKVGSTKGNYTARIEQLQTGNPTAITFLGCIEDGTLRDERTLHLLMAPDHIRLEWFAWTDRVERIVSSVLSGISIGALVRDAAHGYSHEDIWRWEMAELLRGKPSVAKTCNVVRFESTPTSANT